jgi:ribosome-associated protein
MQTLEIETEYITLGQLVKFAGFVGTGGEVKTFLAETEIAVNGESDNRRGRKIYPGDRVTFAEQETVLVTGTASAGENSRASETNDNSA